MSLHSPLRILILLVLGVIAGFFGITSFENYRINKIDFMITDNGESNFMGLTEVEFLESLSSCGAEVDTSTTEWFVDYDGFLLNRNWILRFAPPRGSQRQ